MSGTTNPILGNVGKIVGKFTRKFEKGPKKDAGELFWPARLPQSLQLHYS